MKLSCFCLACLVLFAHATYAHASSETLTPRQEALWQATRQKLDAAYAREGRVPKPMSKEDAEGVRVPLVCDGSKTGMLPWDVRLLLQYDAHLIIDNSQPPQALFTFLLDSAQRLLVPDGVLYFLKDIESLQGASEELDIRLGKAGFFEKGGKLPAVLSLGQIGGDELPGLWLTENTLCTPIVHFNYDEFPEFYLRSLCLLDYVAWYIDTDAMPDPLDSGGTDTPVLLTAREAQIEMRGLQPQIEPLNEALSVALEQAVSEQAE